MSSVIRGSDNFDSEGIVEGTATAWVNFNGTGTVAIRDSYNVSSITDNGVGVYTVNFATLMGNANYSVGGMGGGADINQINVSQPISTVAPTTSSVRLSVTYVNGTLWDTPTLHAQIFGGK